VIIVGLGNPGPEYEGTRHNAGFLIVDAARKRWRGARWRTRAGYRQSTFRLGGTQHRLIRPETFMNCSGEAVAELLRQGARADDFLAVLDDLDLPLGRIRIRPQGGAGGHKGLESIAAAVSPAVIARMRIGVGRPVSSNEAADYVLARFDEEERARFEQVIERALAALQMIVRQGIAAAMNRFNGLSAPWESDLPGGRKAAGATETVAEGRAAERATENGAEKGE
jgi:PTH1 family peptidyl-tRNA hydrolase